jgi:hypothetical protein
MPNRSDYLQIYEEGGAEALNKTLLERFPHKWDPCQGTAPHGGFGSVGDALG